MISSFLQQSNRRNGYIAALTDVYNWVDRHSESLKQNKLFNKKGMLNLLSAFIRDSDTFMNYGDEAELRITPERKIEFIKE